MAVLDGTNFPDVIHGTVNDDLIQGLLADDLLYGFDGNDLIRGGAGDDWLVGGSGNDTLDGGAGEDVVYGGSGNDLVSFASATEGFTLDLFTPALSSGDALGDIYVSIERFVLGGFDDRFIGIQTSDQVLGGAGNDFLLGADGNDSLWGDADDDTLWGGAGQDVLTGGNGNDVLEGGEGADQLFGGAGTLDIASYAGFLFEGLVINTVTGSFQGIGALDSLVGIEGVRTGSLNDAVTLGGAIHWVDGGLGNDTLNGSSGADTLWGGSGVDEIFGAAGNDLLQGLDTNRLINEHHDSLHGGEGLDTLVGGGLGDWLWGDAGDDLAQGDAGNDLIYGGTGKDTLQGGNGNDRLFGGAAGDALEGGDGTDTAVYATLVTVNLANPGAGRGEALGDVFQGVEVIELGLTGSRYVGGTGAMTVRATVEGLTALAGSGAERFEGLGLVDYGTGTTGVTLQGVGGHLQGSGAAAGDEVADARALYTTNGADVVEYSDGQGFYLTEVNLRGGADTLFMLGERVGTYVMGNGSDTIEGELLFGTVDLGNGDDVLDLAGSLGNDLQGKILGGAGNDAINLSGYVQDLDGLNSVSAGSGNDTLTGQVLSGKILGEDGNDVIDILHVNWSGFTLLSGGAGVDTITVTALPSATDVLEKVRLDGGDGADFLTGFDYATTKAHDLFEFTGLWGQDEIVGFDVGQDRLTFFANGLGPETLGDLQIVGQGGDLLITFSGQSILLYGVNAGAFDTSDILFL